VVARLCPWGPRLSLLAHLVHCFSRAALLLLLKWDLVYARAPHNTRHVIRIRHTVPRLGGHAMDRGILRTHSSSDYWLLDSTSKHRSRGSRFIHIQVDPQVHCEMTWSLHLDLPKLIHSYTEFFFNKNRRRTMETYTYDITIQFNLWRSSNEILIS
jgi:hypothetical protein